jgi:outer membrane lipoprotein SlyB
MNSINRIALGTTLAAAMALGSAPASAIDINSTTINTAAPASSATDTGTGQKRGFLSGIFGCGASGGKQGIGAIAGGVLGGVLGNRVAGRGSRTLGTILGGALGAAAGSAIGCKLQKNDQAKAEKAMEDAVATNQSQTWESAETGASGTVEVGQAALEGAGLANLKFGNGVEPASGYTKVGGAFVSTANANIRSAPSTSGKVVGTVATGTRVWVPASVQGQPWYLISDAGVAQGYVSNALLKRVTTETASNCKMVKQTISQPGAKAESETLQACKDSNGQWVMTRV